MHKKLLESIGALEGAWPPRRGQNCLNPCKRGDSRGSGVAPKLLESIGGLEADLNYTTMYDRLIRSEDKAG